MEVLTARNLSNFFDSTLYIQLRDVGRGTTVKQNKFSKDTLITTKRDHRVGMIVKFPEALNSNSTCQSNPMQK